MVSLFTNNEYRRNNEHFVVLRYQERHKNKRKEACDPFTYNIFIFWLPLKRDRIPWWYFFYYMVSDHCAALKSNTFIGYFEHYLSFYKFLNVIFFSLFFTRINFYFGAVSHDSPDCFLLFARFWRLHKRTIVLK